MDVSPNTECLVCRGMGAAYGIGGGTYLALHAPASGMKRWGVLTFASALAALGLARGLNLPPFGGMFSANKSQNS